MHFRGSKQRYESTYRIKGMSDTPVNESISETVRELIRRNISITCMESVTGGMLASLITDTEGASSIFKGSFVTYSNESKINAGVDSAIIEKYGVYSHECAKEMARAVRSAFGADIGIGITGVLKNIDPANTEGEPGRVFFAIEYDGGIITECIDDVPLTERSASKAYICRRVMDRVKRECL